MALKVDRVPFSQCGLKRLFGHAPMSPPPATASAEGAQLNGRPFPATASAEGRQFNGAPSFRATLAHLIGTGGGGVERVPD